MKLVLIGIQGSGKSTQGNLLSKQLGVPYLSTGHIFRAIAKEKTALGKKVKILMSSGLLIPDSLTIEIVNNYLSRSEYRKGYIIDGFPRTITQVKKFKNNVDRVLHIHIPDKEALWRLAYRNEERDDDTIEAIKKRIELFKKHTSSVLDYYEKKDILVEIDGTQTIRQVNEAVLKSLGKKVVKNQLKTWKQKGNTIIAVVGLPGAGKTNAAKYLKKKHNLPLISFSDIVNKKVEKIDPTHSLKVHHDVRQGLRALYGFEAMAKLSADKIKLQLSKSKIIIIEGMRSWEEYLYLKNEFSKVRVFILCVFADKQKRYRRIKKRTTRSGLAGKERDLDELLNTHMGPTIAYADYIVKNNYSIDEFQQKLDEIYREVSFS